MKNILLVLIAMGVMFTSCKEAPTDTDARDSYSLAVVGDPPDEPEEPEECELTNDDWQDFTDEVIALFDEDEIAEIEEALGEPIACSLLSCFEDNYNNHGGFVSCISHWTNSLKKDKAISGKDKGKIMRIAAQSEVGK